MHIGIFIIADTADTDCSFPTSCARLLNIDALSANTRLFGGTPGTRMIIKIPGTCPATANLIVPACRRTRVISFAIQALSVLTPLATRITCVLDIIQTLAVLTPLAPRITCVLDIIQALAVFTSGTV